MKLIPSLFLAALPCLPFVGGLVGAQDPTEKQPRAEVGAVAETFRVNDQLGRLVTFAGKGERWTILAFYPKAATPGCTKEMCSLRDCRAELERLGADVYGVSRDSVEELAKFAKDQSLDFRLLSDPDGSVTQKFEVGMDGRPVARRVTIVIDPKGVIRARDEGVQVDAHGKDLIELLKRLRDEQG